MAYFLSMHQIYKIFWADSCHAQITDFVLRGINIVDHTWMILEELKNDWHIRLHSFFYEKWNFLVLVNQSLNGFKLISQAENSFGH